MLPLSWVWTNVKGAFTMISDNDRDNIRQLWHHSCFRGLKVEKNIGYCFSISSGSILYSNRLSNLSFHANCSTLCSHWEKIVNIFNSFKNLKTRFHFRVEDQSSWRSYKLTGKALCFSKPQLIWMRWVKRMFVKVWKFESMKVESMKDESDL